MWHQCVAVHLAAGKHCATFTRRLRVHPANDGGSVQRQEFALRGSCSSSTWQSEELSRVGQVVVRVGRALPLDTPRSQNETRSASCSVRRSATWRRRTGARSMFLSADSRRMDPGRGSSKHRLAPGIPQTAAQHTRVLQGTWDRLSRLTVLLCSRMRPGVRADPMHRGGSDQVKKPTPWGRIDYPMGAGAASCLTGCFDGSRFEEMRYARPGWRGCSHE